MKQLLDLVLALVVIGFVLVITSCAINFQPCDKGSYTETDVLGVVTTKTCRWADEPKEE